MKLSLPLLLGGAVGAGTLLVLVSRAPKRASISEALRAIRVSPILRAQIDGGKYRVEPMQGMEGQAVLSVNGVIALQGNPKNQRIVRMLLNEAEKGLPAGATPYAGDQYSTEMWSFPAYCPAPQGNAPYSPCQFLPIDEWGRIFPGEYSQSGFWESFYLNIVSPLMPVTVFIPIYGPMIYAALRYAQAIGSQESLLDASLAVARAQLSPEQQLLFDVGVGMARGKSPQQMAGEVLMQQLSPEQQAAVEMGRRLGG